MMLKLHPTIRDFIAVLLYNPSTKALKAMPDTMTIMYLSDLMRSADKLCISTPITSHQLFWFSQLRNSHGIT